MSYAREVRIVRRGLERLLLRLLLRRRARLTALGAARRRSLAASPTIDSIVVKLRDGVIVDSSAGLPASERAALDAALQVPFSHVGYKRNGALKLQLLPAARAGRGARRGQSRATAAEGALRERRPDRAPPLRPIPPLRHAAAAQPPVRRLIVKFRDPATSAAAQTERSTRQCACQSPLGAGRSAGRPPAGDVGRRVCRSSVSRRCRPTRPARWRHARERPDRRVRRARPADASRARAGRPVVFAASGIT